MAARLGWSRYWLVDPLDGTKEFVSRNGEFTVNIALIEQGTPRWGLVYAPVLDKLWYGARGLAPGVWPMAGTRPSRPVLMTLGRVWRVVGSRNHLSQETLEYLARFGELERGEIELVSMGSSLKFCIIAEGRPSFLPAARADLRGGIQGLLRRYWKGGGQRHPARWFAALLQQA